MLDAVLRTQPVIARTTQEFDACERLGTFIPIAGGTTLAEANLLTCGAPSITARAARPKEPNFLPGAEGADKMLTNEGFVLLPVCMAFDSVGHGV
jgi:hypothetical protein